MPTRCVCADPAGSAANQGRRSTDAALACATSRRTHTILAGQPHVPPEFEPKDGETAVLSLLAVRDGPGWNAVSGSLLTVPDELAHMSWRQWSAIQPHAPQHVDSRGTLDPGAVFCVEPFSCVRAIRHAVDAQQWRSCVESLGRGQITVNGDAYDLATVESTPVVLLGHDGVGPAYDVVAGAMRPVRGIATTLEAPELPETGSTWELEMPENLERGPERGRLWQERHLLHWPRELLGIDWTGDTETGAPACLVIGRPVSKAWIVRVKPDFDADGLIISIGWDEQLIDPLGCSLLIRTESNGVPLLVRHLRITELPEIAPAVSEPRAMAWSDRTLDVQLPRGARRTEWGLTLLSSSGELLDERPVALRVEQISMAIHVNDGAAPASTITMGDKKAPPTKSETDEAIQAALAIEATAREAASHRRLATAGELEDYLRWRFCCRAGELLLLDPYLLHDKPDDVIAFLRRLNRPIRALARSIPSEAARLLVSVPTLDVRPLPNGKATVHDRIWIVGETGVLVGASVGTFLADSAGARRRATTATDLPFADTAAWRQKFEEWWPRR